MVNPTNIKKIRNIFIFGVIFSLGLTMTLSSVDSMTLQTFLNHYADENPSVWNAKVNLLDTIYKNNPDLFNNELEYERGIIQLLNLN